MLGHNWFLGDWCPNTGVPSVFESESVSRLVMSDSLKPHGLQPVRLPSPRNSPDKHTGVSCHFLLQAIFLTQGSNLGLQHSRQPLYRLSHQGKPKIFIHLVVLSLSCGMQILSCGMWDLVP